MSRLKNSDLPFINLSKENLFLLCDTLELDEIGLIITALKGYIYDGVEPNFERKSLNGAWKQVLLLVDRKADGCFKRREQISKINKDRKTKTNESHKTADLSPSNSQDEEIYHQEGDNGSNRLKMGNTSELNDNTIIENKTEEDMGTFICNIEGEQQEVKKNDMSSIDRLIPAQNKCMALRQVKPYLTQDENLRRLNDSLGVFLKGVDKEEKTEYYLYITQVYLNQVNALEKEYSKILS